MSYFFLDNLTPHPRAPTNYEIYLFIIVRWICTMGALHWKLIVTFHQNGTMCHL